MVIKTNTNYFQWRPNIEYCCTLNPEHTGDPFGFMEYLFVARKENPTEFQCSCFNKITVTTCNIITQSLL